MINPPLLGYNFLSRTELEKNFAFLEKKVRIGKETRQVREAFDENIAHI
jgi:hypothetical protein